jgi:gamma-glutamylputrescine oxidase
MQLSYWELQYFINNSDLLVIGSGIVGLNAAISYKKKNPKANVLVVESGILPSGASTKNAGFACFGSVSELVDDLGKMDESLVWNTVELRYKGLLRLKSILGEKAMDYKALGGFEVFDNKQEFESCASRIHEFNLSAHRITKLKGTYKVNKRKIESSGFKGFKYCIENVAEGQINTGIMMRNLIQLAQSMGVLILNNIHVSKIKDSGSQVHVLLADGTEVKTKKIIVATNGFAKELLKIKDVAPARAQVIITEPVPDLKIKGAFHYQQGYYYFRNIDGRVLFGGGRNLDFKTEETTELGLTNVIQDSLESILKNQILPNTKYKIEHRWSGIMGVGSEKRPIIKHVSPNVVCAVRMGGMGVAIGSLVGEMAVNEMLQG